MKQSPQDPSVRREDQKEEKSETDLEREQEYEAVIEPDPLLAEVGEAKEGEGRRLAGRPTRSLQQAGVEVQQCCLLRRDVQPEGGQGRQRHHVTFVIADVKLSNIFRAVAVSSLGLDVHLPLPSEAIEVINE